MTKVIKHTDECNVMNLASSEPCNCGGVGLLTVEQPAPVPNDRPCIQDLVIQDMEARKVVGLQRYGTLLKMFNGRDALRDLYEELLDAAQYIRQEIEERHSMTAKVKAYAESLRASARGGLSSGMLTRDEIAVFHMVANDLDTL